MQRSPPGPRWAGQGLERSVDEDQSLGMPRLTPFIGVDLYVVDYARGWKDPVNARGRDDVVTNPLVQHPIGISKQFLRLIPVARVLKHTGIFRAQLPGGKKRRPVDEIP